MTELPVIQSLWIGQELSLMEKLSIHSFLQNGHEYHLYTYNPVQGVPEGVILKDASEIMPYSDMKTRANFANIFRYKLLFEQGGIWADVDFVCLKPIKFEAEYAFGWQENPSLSYAKVNNAFIKAPKGSALMKDCYDYVIDFMNNLQDHDKRLVWTTLGPKLLTKKVREHNLTAFALPPVFLYPIGWRDFIKFIMPSAYKFSDESYAVHLWNELWKKQRLNGWYQLLKNLISGRYIRIGQFTRYAVFNRNKVYGTNTVLGRLQKQYLSAAVILLLLVPSFAVAQTDTDGDGLSDEQEITYSTDPRNADTDGGGEADGAEVAGGRDPTKPEDDLTFDRDNDGLTNGEELSQGTDPDKADTDGDGTNDGDDRYPLSLEYQQDNDEDGMPDEYEKKYNFSSTLRADAEEDTDKDGLKNVEEFIYGTDPLDPDTDHDGVLDGDEVELGTEPLENPCLDFGSPKQPFADVNDHWAEAFIVRLQRVKVLPTGARLAEGYSDGDVQRFAPDRAISRFELLKLALMSSCTHVRDVSDAEREFSDIRNVSRPFESDDRAQRRMIVYSAVAEGIVEGYPDGTFRPDDQVNRAEALKILLTAARLKSLSEYDVPAPKFSDVPESAWFRSAIELAVGYDLLSGYEDGTFKPEQPITRAEAAKLVYLFMLINPHVNGYVLPADGLGITESTNTDQQKAEESQSDTSADVEQEGA